MKLKRYIEIIKKNQRELKVYLSQWLYENYECVIDVDGFLYATGNIPIMLVAHMDTVHKNPPRTIWMSLDCNKLKCDEGIGGDDRNGVAMIMDIVETLGEEVRPYILFTEDEEIGGVGARDFAKLNIKPELNFIIELDRRGRDDAVFYDCDNKDFIDFIEEFGFKESFGSFSDISVIAEPLGVAAVNLSSGYYQAHTVNEYVNLQEMDEIMEKVINIIKSQTVSETSKKFSYVKKKYTYSTGYNKYYNYYYDDDDWNWYQNQLSKATSKKKQKVEAPKVCQYCGSIATTEDEMGQPVCNTCAKELGMVKCAECGKYDYPQYMYQGDDKKYYCEDCFVR